MARVSDYVISEATGESAVPPEHEVLDELEALGLIRIGLLSVRTVDEASALARYDEADIDRALAHLRRVRPVFATPEHDLFAVVDVAESVAVVSLVTLLESGELVETFNPPTTRTPLPAQARAKRQAFFTQSAAPGRHVDVVEGDVATALQEHRERVTAHGTPGRHDDMEQLIGTATAMLRHDEQVRDQRQQLARVARWVPWLLALVLGTLIAVALGQAGVTGTPVGALGTVFVLSLFLSWLLRLAQPKVNAALLRSPERRPRFSLKA